jgi:hypothetical protein
MIDRKNGGIDLKRYREVVADDAEIENEVAQMPLSAMPNAKLILIRPSVNF